MKTLNRKLKISLIFFVCWFILLFGLIDGLGQFETVLNVFGGSYALTEIVLWTIVILPTVLVYIFTKNNTK